MSCLIRKCHFRQNRYPWYLFSQARRKLNGDRQRGILRSLLSLCGLRMRVRFAGRIGMSVAIKVAVRSRSVARVPQWCGSVTQRLKTHMAQTNPPSGQPPKGPASGKPKGEPSSKPQSKPSSPTGQPGGGQPGSPSGPSGQPPKR